MGLARRPAVATADEPAPLPADYFIAWQRRLTGVSARTYCLSGTIRSSKVHK